ncbi:unnamed protein product [Polarella glacialis]|uniref:Uncharacterized protein n=1 Tax=Polarella glacialis TaxID=89957 RepID=A0A813FR06_POLGL|nr:unnamed protein product [Polarella glacialis]
MQQMAGQLSEQTRDYGQDGKGALAVFCALAKVGGGRSFRRLTEEKVAKLVEDVASLSGLRREAEDLGGISTEDAADFFCALARLGIRDVPLMKCLSRFLADRLAELAPSFLPNLTRALGRSEPSDDFVLLHAICRRSCEPLTSGELDGPSAVALLQACSRWELYDEALLSAVAHRLEASAAQIPVAQLCEVVYALSSLHARDVVGLDPLCDALGPRADELGEADIVRLLRGLMKLRHRNDALLASLTPVIDKAKWSINPVSLTNLISAFSFFGGQDEFFNGLLHVATSRMNRLPSTSVQHILMALCRQQGRMDREALELTLQKLCQHITSPAVAMQLSPVQALSSLAALAKLQYRDLPAISVLTSVLVGRGGDVCWSWAPSEHFHKGAPPLQSQPRPFSEIRSREVLQGSLDSSHGVEILQSLSWLDLNSNLTAHLTAVLCGILEPQLHELRAKEVLVVARAFSAARLPELVSAEEPSAALWREQALDHCLESLRRHENFLESSWTILLPFKLLCLEVDLGTFGTRKLSDVLNPMLFSFVERLRSLTKETCEANRLRDEEAADEEATTEVQGPLILEGLRHRIVVGSVVQDFQVDIVLEARIP